MCHPVPQPRSMRQNLVRLFQWQRHQAASTLDLAWSHEEVRDEDAKMLVLPGVPGIVEPRTVKDFGGKSPDCMSLAGRIDTAPAGAVECCGGVTTLRRMCDERQERSPCATAKSSICVED